MHELLKKLNYKGQEELFILNSPDSFEHVLNTLKDVKINRNPSRTDKVKYAIIFAITQKELNDGINALGPQLEGDAILWVGYPKKSSKKYQCEFSRDSGWEEFGKYELEPVRQVAIDEDWSALRFRKVDFIKKLTRNKKMVLSRKGKDRV